jgi:hypothetical protein
MTDPDAQGMAELREALAALRVDDREPPSLGGLLRAWRELSTAVERGYDWSVDEYWNDLACRSRLARVRDAAPAASGWLDDELRVPDERFRAATRESRRPRAEAPWFMNRVPTAPGPELARDIEALGL